MEKGRSRTVGAVGLSRTVLVIAVERLLRGGQAPGRASNLENIDPSESGGIPS